MVTKSPLSNKNALIQAIAVSKSIAEVLKYFDMAQIGGNYKTLKKYAKEFDLALPIFNPDFRKKPKRVASEILISDSKVYGLGKFLLSSGLKVNQCEECGQLPWWNNKPMSLTVDHINGDNLDNRIENLKMLCWNCHSQTSTFGSKNTKNRIKPNFCECGQKISKQANKCISCSNKNKAVEHFLWPEINSLLAQVQQLGYSEVGRRIGCSDNAVKKHIQSIGVDLPKMSRGPRPIGELESRLVYTE